MKAVTLALLLFVKILYGANVARSNDSKSLKISSRIYKGLPVDPQNVPYIAYMRIASFWDKLSQVEADSSIQWCTGTIISRYWVLTAAHCLQAQYLYNTLNPYRDDRWANVQVEVGVNVGMVDRNAESRDNRRKRIYIDDNGDIFPHPKAVEYTSKNDIYGEYLVDVALLRIKGGLPRDEIIESVPLMSGNFTSRNELSECIGMGYGSENDGVSPLQLNYHNVQVGDSTYCNQIFPSDRWRPYHLCVTGANGSRACAGDSGSPLLCGDPDWPVVVGVLHGTFGDYFCGPSPNEVHYVSTGYVENWIRTTTQAEDLRFVPFKL